MQASPIEIPHADLDLTSTQRIISAVLSLSQDDPWEARGASILSAVEQELAKFRLNFTDQWTDGWRTSECRAKLRSAERELRSEGFREQSGLQPWGLLIATVGASALTDDEGNSPLHWAAENGAWHAVPARALTADGMLQLNASNETPFEIAARRHGLQSIDEDTLVAVARTPNRNGDTALHHAARGGYLMCLPPCLKSEELLAMEDPQGVSVLERHLAGLHAAS